jgi:hypothetical protein
MEEVSYALIGGLAVSLHGQPRVTVDVDMIIAADVSRALELTAALDGSSFRPLFDDVSEVVQKAFILPLRHRSTGVKVDLAIGLSGFEQQVVARAQHLNLAGVDVFVATPEDLLIMKLLAGRPRDEEDLEGLVIVQGDRLDWKYCRELAIKLGEAVGQDLAVRLDALRGGQGRDT